MNDFVQDYLKDAAKVNSLRQKLQDHSDGHDHGEIDIELMLKEQAQQEFKRANLERYKKIYFPDAASVTTYPEICDNGGFEDGFLHYEGFISTYTSGSNSCSPISSGSPITYLPTTLPLTNRFEIVTTGTDPLIGIDQVKFGSKALRINNKYGHASNCNGNFGIDKLKKEFIVDADNREFTIWYAVALENPTGHIDEQPFLNINCDLAPQDELCFDADFLKCMDKYTDRRCVFDSIDVLDWTCHRFSIPASEIGNIATLEIVVADCGASAHFGYAYIDGFCESCAGSSLGSIELYYNEGTIENPTGTKLLTCSGDSITICGYWTEPQICDNVYLDSLVFSDFPKYNLFIDSVSKTFCFQLSKEDFRYNCYSLSAEIYFSTDGTKTFYEFSNPFELCAWDFLSYNMTADVSNCYDNGSTTQISDDYYYVDISLNIYFENWQLIRDLDSPYPNELGEFVLEEGVGSTELTLGPFLIQEGNWTLIANVDGCPLLFTIEPPEYCSGCTDFGDIEISNITCNAGTPPASDTWGFTLNVPSSSTFGYSITSIYLNNSNNSYNQANTFSGFLISNGCLVLTLEDTNPFTACGIELIICPPKPCNSESNCEDLEVSINKLICDERNNGTYQALIDVEGEGNSYICYETVGLDPLISGNSNVGSLSSQTLIGPFSDDVFLTVFLCSSPNCSSTACSDPQCFKTIFVPKPDCTDPGFSTNGRSKMPKKHRKNAKVSVMPNPIQNNEFIILSDLDITEFEVYDLSGKRICNGVFEGRRHQVSNVNLESGIYLLKYITINGKAETTKFVKL